MTRSIQSASSISRERSFQLLWLGRKGNCLTTKTDWNVVQVNRENRFWRRKKAEQKLFMMEWLCKCSCKCSVRLCMCAHINCTRHDYGRCIEFVWLNERTSFRPHQSSFVGQLLVMCLYTIVYDTRDECFHVLFVCVELELYSSNSYSCVLVVEFFTAAYRKHTKKSSGVAAAGDKTQIEMYSQHSLSTCGQSTSFIHTYRSFE